MQKTRTGQWLGIVFVVFGVLAIVGLVSFAGPCPIHDDGSASACVGTSHILVSCALAAVLFQIASLAVANIRAKQILSAAAVLLAMVLAFAAGTFLPLCMMETMRCWTIMRPFAMVVGVAMLAVGLARGILIARQLPKPPGEPT